MPTHFPWPSRSSSRIDTATTCAPVSQLSTPRALRTSKVRLGPVAPPGGRAAHLWAWSCAVEMVKDEVNLLLVQARDSGMPIPQK